MAAITTGEIRTFIFDNAADNVLLDKEEFSDSYLDLCITLALDSYNVMPPASAMTLDSFPSKVLLMYGACWHAFAGKAASYARNSLTYTDGGVQVPIEEKAEIYLALSSNYRDLFMSAARSYKSFTNIEDGWSYISSDQATFPYF